MPLATKKCFESALGVFEPALLANMPGDKPIETCCYKHLHFYSHEYLPAFMKAGFIQTAIIFCTDLLLANPVSVSVSAPDLFFIFG